MCRDASPASGISGGGLVVQGGSVEMIWLDSDGRYNGSCGASCASDEGKVRSVVALLSCADDALSDAVSGGGAPSAV